MQRKICIVTGTRAEYGHLYWLMREIKEDTGLELQVIATGAHLSPEFGLTYQIIEADGFAISAKVEMLLSSDSPVGITKSMGLGLIGFADALAQLKPDLLVVLGDRYESLVAAQAAMIARIPIAHLHGGETTEGVIDEAIRHAITKMAHLHFVAAESYRARVIQLGETPKCVFNFGAPGLDHLQRLPLLNKNEFEGAIDFKLGKITFLVTYHPVTLSTEPPQKAIEELLAAFDQFPDAHIILTKQNADTDGRVIGELLDAYGARYPHRVKVYPTLGYHRYLSAIQHTTVVIGNSSSGVIEAPAMKKPTVNIGERQTGRLKASSVIDCLENSNSIVAAIRKALSLEFQQTLATVTSPYGVGNVAVRIKDILKKQDLKRIVFKKFHNIDFG